MTRSCQRDLNQEVVTSFQDEFNFIVELDCFLVFLVFSVQEVVSKEEKKERERESTLNPVMTHYFILVLHEEDETSSSLSLLFSS